MCNHSGINNKSHDGECEDLSNVSVARQKRFLKGIERNEVAQQIGTNRAQAYNVYMGKMGEMNDEEVQAGNTTHCQSRQVLRQCGYELRKEELSSDMILEVKFQKDAWVESIRGKKVNGYI